MWLVIWGWKMVDFFVSSEAEWKSTNTESNHLWKWCITWSLDLPHRQKQNLIIFSSSCISVTKIHIFTLYICLWYHWNGSSVTLLIIFLFEWFPLFYFCSIRHNLFILLFSIIFSSSSVWSEHICTMAQCWGFMVFSLWPAVPST